MFPSKQVKYARLLVRNGKGMGEVLKIEGGRWTDFWLTDRDVLQITVAPSSYVYVTTAAFIAVAILLARVLKPTFVSGVILAAAGGAVAAALGSIFGSLLANRSAIRRRRELLSLTSDQMRVQKRKVISVPWSGVESVKLSGRTMTLCYGKHQMKMLLPPKAVMPTREYVSAKLAGRMVIEQSGASA